MTVSANTNSGSYVSDGLATPRSINFRLINHADLIVTANGVTQTLNVHYSLSGTYPAITMTPITPYWASGVVVRYRRKTPAKQEYDPQPGVDLSANSIEFELDRQTLALQDLDAEVDANAARSVFVAEGEVAPELDLSGLVEGALLKVAGGKIVPFDHAPFAGKYYAGGPGGIPIPATGLGGGDMDMRTDLADPAIGPLMVGVGAGNLSDALGLLVGEGAVGNGIANDKAFIDAVNLAGRMVNLLGKDYAYTGDVDLRKARFTNGRILSSTMGTLDFRSDVVRHDRTITIGAAGELKKLRHLFPYLRHLSILGSVKAVILEQNTPNDATGSTALDVADCHHPDEDRIEIEGLAFGAGQGAIDTANFPGRTGQASIAAAKALDYAYALSRYPSSIYLTGDDTANGSYGMNLSRGGVTLRRLLVDEHTRYGVSVNWNGSHSGKTKGGGRFVLEESCLFGSPTWGATLYDVNFVIIGKNVIAYPQNGGGLYQYGGEFTEVANGTANLLTVYFPDVPAASTFPKYGLFFDGVKLNVDVRGDGSSPIKIDGPILHAVYMINGCTGTFPDLFADKATVAMTQIRGCDVDIRTVIGRNADPARTALTVGGEQLGTPDNTGQGAYVYIGPGCHDTLKATDFENVVCQYYFRSDGGRVQSSPSAKFRTTNCKATTKAFAFLSSRGNTLYPEVTLPQAGSNDGLSVSAGSDVHLWGNSGVSPDVTVNTFGAANWVSQ